MALSAFEEITANGLWPASSLCNGIEGPNRVPPNPKQVAICREWLALFAIHTKTIRPRRCSYEYKHDVERWTEKRGPREYIANGAFIAAAVAEGYRLKPTSDGSPNAYFNLGPRPTGAE